MELKELIKQKMEKTKELEKLDEQINECKNLNAIICYETLIKTFEELEDLLPFETLEIEIYCEECETDRDVQVEFDEIIKSLRYDKEMLERKVMNNGK